MGQHPNVIYLASIWVIPLVIAITFHEAAHGFVARFLGDETAWRLGRGQPQSPQEHRSDWDDLAARPVLPENHIRT